SMSPHFNPSDIITSQVLRPANGEFGGAVKTAIAWRSQLAFNSARLRAASAAASGEADGFNSGSPRTETRLFSAFKYQARSVAVTGFTDSSESSTSRHAKASSVYKSGES